MDSDVSEDDIAGGGGSDSDSDAGDKAASEMGTGKGTSITAYVRKYEGTRWKALDWQALNRVRVPQYLQSQNDKGKGRAKGKGKSKARGSVAAGTLLLQHNRAHVYRKHVDTSSSLADALQELAAVGKRRCNPRITGFIKVVENTSFQFDAGGGFMPLASILEEQICSG